MKKSIEKKLLLLNIEDNELNELFTGLQELFNKKRSKSIPHITLRGPYNESPSKKTIDMLHNSLIKTKLPLQIKGVDMFKNNNTYVVYLKVYQEKIEKTSWKKDYPKKKYGFNPHISIYNGKDEALANKILFFLKNENLSFECNEYSLDLHTLNSKQSKMDYQYIKHFNEVLNSNNKYAYLLKKALSISKMRYTQEEISLNV